MSWNLRFKQFLSPFCSKLIWFGYDGELNWKSNRLDEKMIPEAPARWHVVGSVSCTWNVWQRQMVCHSLVSGGLSPWWCPSHTGELEWASVEVFQDLFRHTLSPAIICFELMLKPFSHHYSCQEQFMAEPNSWMVFRPPCLRSELGWNKEQQWWPSCSGGWVHVNVFNK